MSKDNQKKIEELRKEYDDKKITYGEYASKFMEIRGRKYGDWRDYPAKDL